MRTRLLRFDPRSFLLVLVAFTGNAEIGGIDLVLSAFIPAAFLFQTRDPWVIRRGAVGLFMALSALLAFAEIRSLFIGITYFPAYYLWPIKALLLMVLVATGRELRWPMGNMLLLGIFCFSLVFWGHVEDGRLVSVFGPNMLYRIFGLMLFFSAMLFLNNSEGHRIVLAILAAFGVFAANLTGSSGALLVIITVALVVIMRLSYKLGIFLLLVAISWVSASGVLSGNLTAGSGAPVIYSRLLYKLASTETNDRLLAWTKIMVQPPSLIGYNHADFDDLWTFGLEYPHNIVVELYGFYGLLGIILSVLLLLSLFRARARIVAGDVLAITCAVLTLGAMLSGDLSDNYGAIGLALGLLLRERALNSRARPQNRRTPIASAGRGAGPFGDLRRRSNAPQSSEQAPVA